MTKKLVFPQVPPKFRGAKMPEGFVNDVRGWTASRIQVEDAVRDGRLLTLDIDMAGHGACGLRCGHCWRDRKEFRKAERMDFAELAAHLREAKALGLLSVKIIGPGEPLEDRALFPLLKLLADMDVIPLIFTKGHVLGDDMTSVRIHGMDGERLAAELKSLGATILLGATSFDDALEDGIVGRAGYSVQRRNALMRLMEAGFADFIPGQATRLGLSFSPVQPKNVDEAFEAYLWARERNIQPILAPNIIAGKAKLMKGMVVEREALVSLYVRMNTHAIERGIFTLDELQERGVSAYGSAAPCSQLSVGMFLRGDGVVLRCPGNDTSILGNVREKSLRQIWEESVHQRRFPNPVNNMCPPKLAGGSFPKDFFREVLRRVMAHFAR